MCSLSAFTDPATRGGADEAHLLDTLAVVAAVAAFAGLLSFAASATARASRMSTSLTVMEHVWRAHLRSGAAADPNRRFSNPSLAALNARLRIAANRYHFTVISVQVLRPRQEAPFVVVETSDRRALLTATGTILRLIDPKTRTNDDRTGWAHEGFLFKARDNDGVPFLAAFNGWRGPHLGGGQWASNPSFYPFPHG